MGNRNIINLCSKRLLNEHKRQPEDEADNSYNSFRWEGVCRHSDNVEKNVSVKSILLNTTIFICRMLIVEGGRYKGNTITRVNLTSNLIYCYYYYNYHYSPLTEILTVILFC